MYLNFYKLTRDPFHITPDPEFLFLSDSHKQALASIMYGVENKKGFVAITGAVGVGKTTIVRAYLDSVANGSLKIIYVFHANVSFKGLVRTIYQELGYEIPGDDIYEMINQLHLILIKEYGAGHNVVLIIDEVQNMPIETLESLRMLSNLETATDKLIQIVLIGQPEFEAMLDKHELRQLKQRIAIRATIASLTPRDSMLYIQHRLAKAGLSDTSIFTKDALRLVIKHACGIPRTINILCDNALITGFGYQRKTISGKIVKEVISDFYGQKRRALLRWQVVTPVCAVILLCMAIAWASLTGHLLSPAPNNSTTQQLNHPTVSPSPALSPPASSSSEQARETTSVTKIVKKGDTLSHLVGQVYGNTHRRYIDLVRGSNPHIRDANKIMIGSEIHFPDKSNEPGD